jgi:hypothetical protein
MFAEIAHARDQNILMASAKNQANLPAWEQKGIKYAWQIIRMRTSI